MATLKNQPAPRNDDDAVPHPVTVCDTCLTVAYDHGIRDDQQAQAHMMEEIGSELEDHNCDAKDEPDCYPQGCGCACYTVRWTTSKGAPQQPTTYRTTEE